MERSEQSFENRENVGRNIEVVIHFMRHGPKDEKGGLTKEGAVAAQETGEKMSDREAIKLYISDRARVRDTAEAIIRGAQLTKTMKTRVRAELSMGSLELKRGQSEFFRKVREEKMEKMSEVPTELREQALAQTEMEYVQEWLDYDTRRPDKNTAAPQEVAQNIVRLIDTYIRMSDRLKSGSKVDLVNVTHDFMMAALIKYLLNKKENDGTMKRGDTILKNLGRIHPLEDLQIIVKLNEAGEKSIEVFLRGERYDLDMDQFKKYLDSERAT